MSTHVPDSIGKYIIPAQLGCGATSCIIRSTEPVLLVEINAAPLSEASDACQVQFNKSCIRTLFELLSAANKKLTERSAKI